MSFVRQVFKSPIAFCAAAIVGIVFSLVFGQAMGGWAFALGVVGAGFNLLAMRWVIRLAAEYAASPDASPKPTKMTLLIVFAFFIKLPVFVALGAYVQTLGGVALPCFLWGIGLVYFALVGWATATS